MKVKNKLILFISIILISSFIYAEELTTFLDIPFGSQRSDVCMNMIKQGWTSENYTGKQIIFSGGNVNYDDLLIFDQVSLYFTDHEAFYQARFVLFDKDKSFTKLQNYVQKIIEDNNLQKVTVEKGATIYLSKGGYLFSVQLQDSKEFPFVIIEKGKPTIVKDEVDLYKSLESLNPKLCTKLQEGDGLDFYYIVADVPDTNYNALYFSKTKDFDNVVYAGVFTDPDGITLANYIDKNKQKMTLSEALENTNFKSYQVSWCKKLIYYQFTDYKY